MTTLIPAVVPPNVSCPFARAAIAAAPATSYDPFDSVFLRDPCAIFAQLRSEAPVAYAPAIDMWTVTDHDDIDAIFRDPHTFSAGIAQSPLDPIDPRARVCRAEARQTADVLLRRGFAWRL